VTGEEKSPAQPGAMIGRGISWFQARFDRKETVRCCRVLAQNLYQKDNILSHERVAGDLEKFLSDRYAGDEAMLSVIEFEGDIATYLSCGEQAIKHALAVLLRLAMAFEDDPGYREEWRP
jgi:hypothetical protein